MKKFSSLLHLHYTLAFGTLVSSSLILAGCATSNSSNSYDEKAFTEELVPILSIALGDESPETIQSTAQCIAHKVLPQLNDSDVNELTSNGLDIAEFSDEGFAIIDTAFSTCTE